MNHFARASLRAMLITGFESWLGTLTEGEICDLGDGRLDTGTMKLSQFIFKNAWDRSIGKEVQSK